MQLQGNRVLVLCCPELACPERFLCFDLNEEVGVKQLRTVHFDVAHATISHRDTLLHIPSSWSGDDLKREELRRVWQAPPLAVTTSSSEALNCCDFRRVWAPHFRFCALGVRQGTWQVKYVSSQVEQRYEHSYTSQKHDLYVKTGVLCTQNQSKKNLSIHEVIVGNTCIHIVLIDVWNVDVHIHLHFIRGAHLCCCHRGHRICGNDQRGCNEYMEKKQLWGSVGVTSPQHCVAACNFFFSGFADLDKY